MTTKFYYFDGRGIGEPIRWILSFGGIDFEDVRVPYNKFPPTLPEEIKSKCKFGQVPLLVESDGRTLTQSIAVARYCATKAKLVPLDGYSAALCDEYVDAVKDLLDTIYREFMKKDDKPKEEKFNDALNTIRSKFLGVFESLVKANDGKHLVGNSITWADVYLAYTVDHLKHLIGIDVSEGYENIKSLTKEVTTSPKIKAWLEKRPLTKY